VWAIIHGNMGKRGFLHKEKANEKGVTNIGIVTDMNLVFLVLLRSRVSFVKSRVYCLLEVGGFSKFECCFEILNAPIGRRGLQYVC
jgi:hypothetical protein